MILSKPKQSRSPSPPRNVRQLGMPIRKSRTPPGVLYSYSDTFEDSSAKSSAPQYTESFESDGDTSDTHFNKSTTERIETHISENITTEKYDSSSRLPEYSETFESTALSNGSSGPKYFRSDSISDTYSDYSYTRSRSDSLSGVSMATDTEVPSNLDDDDFTKYDYTSFEDSLSGRFSSGRVDEGTATASYDYSYTFETTDALDDTEKLQREAELAALSKEAEEEFASAMLSNLKQKRFKESDLAQLLEPEQQKKTEEFDKHTANFLKRKVHLLKYKNKNGLTKPVVEGLQGCRNTLTGSPPNLREYGVHPDIIERLRLKNFMKDIENVVKTEIHDPKKCRECRRHSRQMEEASVERNFIREKTRTIRQQMIEDRINKHLVQMGSISLIGNLAMSLPKHSDDPEIVMEKLNRGLSLSKSLSNTRLRTGEM